MPLLSFTSRADSNNFSSPPALPADENILSTHADIALYLNTDNSEGNGTLYCTNKQLIWLNNSKEAGYALDYPSILMHAVCRDTSTFPHACIYCQLDAGDDDEMTQQQDSDSEHSSEDSAEESESAQPEPLNTVPELRFVPADSNTLNEIYDGMCAGALLHPATEQEGEGDFFFDDSEVLGNLSMNDTTGTDSAEGTDGTDTDGMTAAEIEEGYEDDEEAEFQAAAPAPETEQSDSSAQHSS